MSTNLSGQALSWDADGNLFADGTRAYAWDAEKRLVKITYPGTPNKETDFAGACPRAAQRGPGGRARPAHRDHQHATARRGGHDPYLRIPGGSRPENPI